MIYEGIDFNTHNLNADDLDAIHSALYSISEQSSDWEKNRQQMHREEFERGDLNAGLLAYAVSVEELTIKASGGIPWYFRLFWALHQKRMRREIHLWKTEGSALAPAR